MAEASAAMLETIVSKLSRIAGGLSGFGCSEKDKPPHGSGTLMSSLWAVEDRANEANDLVDQIANTLGLPND